MEGAMHVVDKEIGVLEEQQADLLRQLAIVQQQISAAKAERVGFVAALTMYCAHVLDWPTHSCKEGQEAVCQLDPASCYDQANAVPCYSPKTVWGCCSAKGIVISPSCMQL